MSQIGAVVQAASFTRALPQLIDSHYWTSLILVEDLPLRTEKCTVDRHRRTSIPGRHAAHNKFFSVVESALLTVYP